MVDLGMRQLESVPLPLWISKDLIHFFKEEIMKNQFFAAVERFVRDEEGAAAVEYGLLAALIAVVVVVAVSAVGSRLCQTFKSIAERLAGGAIANCTAALT